MFLTKTDKLHCTVVLPDCFPSSLDLKHTDLYFIRMNPCLHRITEEQVAVQVHMMWLHVEVGRILEFSYPPYFEGISC